MSEDEENSEKDDDDDDWWLSCERDHEIIAAKPSQEEWKAAKKFRSWTKTRALLGADKKVVLGSDYRDQ